MDNYLEASVARGETKTTITYGVVGMGKTSSKNAKEEIRDLIDAAEREGQDVYFVLGVSGDDWNKAWDGVMDAIDDAKLDYTAIYDQDAYDDKDLKGIIDDAKDATKVQQVARRVVAELEKADEPRELIVLWNSEIDDESVSDEEAAKDPGYAAVERAQESHIRCVDLTNGLETIALKDDGDAPPPAAARSSKDDDAGEAMYPSRSELEEMERDALKKLADKEGLEVKSRAHTPTIVDMLAEHFEKQAKKATPSSAPAAEQVVDVEDKSTPVTGEAVKVQVDTTNVEQMVEEIIQRELEAAVTAIAEKLDSVLRELRSDGTALGQRIMEVKDLLGVGAERPKPKSDDDDEDDDRGSRRSRRSRDDDEDEDERPRRGRRGRDDDDDDEDRGSRRSRRRRD